MGELEEDPIIKYLNLWRTEVAHTNEFSLCRTILFTKMPRSRRPVSSTENGEQQRPSEVNEVPAPQLEESAMLESLMLSRILWLGLVVWVVWKHLKSAVDSTGILPIERYTEHPVFVLNCIPKLPWRVLRWVSIVGPIIFMTLWYADDTCEDICLEVALRDVERQLWLCRESSMEK